MLKNCFTTKTLLCLPPTFLSLTILFLNRGFGDTQGAASRVTGDAWLSPPRRLRPSAPPTTREGRRRGDPTASRPGAAPFSHHRTLIQMRPSVRVTDSGHHRGAPGFHALCLFFFLRSMWRDGMQVRKTRDACKWPRGSAGPWDGETSGARQS